MPTSTYIDRLKYPECIIKQAFETFYAVCHIAPKHKSSLSKNLPAKKRLSEFLRPQPQE